MKQPEERQAVVRHVPEVHPHIKEHNHDQHFRKCRKRDPGRKTGKKRADPGDRLKQHFRLTLVDLSADMLNVSRRLNHECEHVQGDMRTVRLGRQFDAVFVHDAVDYMTSEADLAAVFTTARFHCRPGGIAVFVPDHVREAFERGTDHGGTDHPDGRGVRFLEWNYDPDPSDTWVVTEYAFLFRLADGQIAAHHETHRTGLFDRATWLRLLKDAGFQVERVTEETEEDRTPRDIFIGRIP